jgi:cbb3-type cytochrome oxidase maturation protein
VDILFLLIPLSVVLALLVLGALWWAVWRGQFDALEGEAERILDSD